MPIEFICVICGQQSRGDNGLCYFKYNPNYYATDCCDSLVCHACANQRCLQKCGACSEKTFVSGYSKNRFLRAEGWMRTYEKYENFHNFRARMPFLIPFAGTGRFGSWKNITRILSNPSDPQHLILKQSYENFKFDSFKMQMLFYSLQSVPMRRIQPMAFQLTPKMFEFFNIMRLSPFWIRRVLLLKWNQFGFIFMMLKKLANNDSLLQTQGERSVILLQRKIMNMIMGVILSKRLWR